MIRNPNENERPALRRLVRAAMSHPCPAPEGAVKEYDWKSPSSFTAAQLQKLQAAAGEIAAELSRSLGGLLNAEPRFRAEAVLLRYGADIAAGEPADSGPDGEGSLFTALAGDDKRRCGWIELPRQTAGDWVARLLGGQSPSSDSSAPRDLSPLERSLLADVFTATATAASTVLRKLGARPVRSQAAGAPGGEAILDRPDMPPEEQSQEYCRLSFRGEGKASCDVILLSEWLAPLADQGAKAASLPPAETQTHLLAHLGQAAVEATAQLGVATVLVQDVVSLEEGDVLVTQTRLGEEIVLEVQGSVVLKAIPVFSDGCYALRVTEVVRPETPKKAAGN